MDIKQTQSEKETIDFGTSIGKKAFAGMLILLYGDLGSGKTHLTKGIAKGLNVTDMVSSPVTHKGMIIYGIGIGFFSLIKSKAFLII